MFRDGELFSIAGVTVRNGKIAEMVFMADPERLRRIDLSAIA